MKAIYIADIHFELKLLAVKIAAFNGVMKYAKEHGYTNIVIAGDIYHVRPAVSTKVVNAVEAAIKYWADNGLKIFLLAGNHDMPSYNTREVTAINSLEHYNNVEVIFENKIFEVDGEPTGFIPYENDVTTFKKYFEEMAAKSPSSIIIHQGVDEAKQPGQPDSGLNTAYFSSVFDGYVVAGDYHKSILLGKFLSPGCLVQDDFGDAGMQKGFWTRDDDEFKFHQSNAPEYIKIELDSIKEIKGMDFTGDHIWFVTSNKRIEKKLYERCEKDSAASCMVSLIKEFVSSHESVIEIAGESEMFEKCLEIRKPNTAKLQTELFDRICVRMETYEESLGKGFDIKEYIDEVAEVSETEEIANIEPTQSIAPVVGDDIDSW